MKIVLITSLIGTAIGFFAGGFFGVAGFGDAWSGAYVFGCVGTVIGLLGGLAFRKR